MTALGPRLIEEPGEEPDETVCYLCQAPLGEDTTGCLVCGHRQYRVCYCGAQLRPDLAICPHCDTDWSQSSRVKARRKSRTHGSIRGLLRSSGTGAITFAAICGTLYLAGGRAAQGMGVEAPANLLVRLWYLGQSVVFNAKLLGGRGLSFLTGGHMVQFLELLIAGAVFGALWYGLRHARWLRAKLVHAKTQRGRRPA